jgi:hypothetical protein
MGRSPEREHRITLQIFLANVCENLLNKDIKEKQVGDSISNNWPIVSMSLL